MSDVRPDPEFNPISHPNFAHLEAQLNSVSPNANQAKTSSLLGHSSQADRPSALTRSQNSSNQAEDDQKDSPEAKQNHFFNQTVQPWDFGTGVAHPSHGDPPDQKSSRWKRKTTDRREQNRANQKAFRERRDLSSEQKDRDICDLEERLNRHEITGREYAQNVIQYSLDLIWSSKLPSVLTLFELALESKFLPVTGLLARLSAVWDLPCFHQSELTASRTSGIASSKSTLWARNPRCQPSVRRERALAMESLNVLHPPSQPILSPSQSTGRQHQKLSFTSKPTKPRMNLDVPPAQELHS
ncbi:hypothetical protein PTTG_29926 [Puccinia triticina 1-1 BBBD Race 1]|uniref:BZIP domain-containing protein n=1 Tax=Puccinia triticina (isolate 1-1 / race 1 (BBBD)) TaxID=630390 RepID=A0A180G131_PUCT1|nr:hypothetical protein PTTG_29926 [Puccinia triticina 1-1 BBBD Race 1]